MQRNARAWLGLVEYDNDALVDEDGYDVEDADEVQYDDETPGDQLGAGNSIQIAIVRPRNFRDAVTIGQYYREGVPVIINLEDMNNSEAYRIIDFASGLILGLSGEIERISRRAFLLMPAGATILTAQNGLTEDGFFNQALRYFPLGGELGRSARHGSGGQGAAVRAGRMASHGRAAVETVTARVALAVTERSRPFLY